MQLFQGGSSAFWYTFIEGNCVITLIKHFVFYFPLIKPLTKILSIYDPWTLGFLGFVNLYD